jgi:thymidylate synthase
MTIHHFETKDLAEDYCTILKHILDCGDEVAPRGKMTKELLSFTLELTDPTRALVRGTERKIHVGLAAAEALQLVGGFSDPRAMWQVSPHLDAFLDGGVFHAPYGPRVATQIPEAIEWLRRDPSTRKAHVAFWDPQQDLWCHDTRDHPCTTHAQFMIRDGALNMHVGMRANDAWRGFPYDVFQFCQLQLAIAASLGLEPGTYYHHATSFHLYEDDWDRASVIQSSSQPPITGMWGGDRWPHTQSRARGLFYGTNSPINDGETLMYNALRKAGVTGSW